MPRILDENEEIIGLMTLANNVGVTAANPKGTGVIVVVTDDKIMINRRTLERLGYTTIEQDN